MPYSLIRNWRTFFAVGAFVSAVGLAIFLHPLIAMRVMFIISGIALVGIGLYAFFADYHSDDVGDVAFGALLCFMLGLACIVITVLPLTLLAYLIAAQTMVAAIVQIAVASEMRNEPALRALLVGCATLSFVIGVLLLLAPLLALQALLALSGLCLFALGVVVMWVTARLGRLSNIY